MRMAKSHSKMFFVEPCGYYMRIAKRPSKIFSSSSLFRAKSVLVISCVWTWVRYVSEQARLLAVLQSLSSGQLKFEFWNLWSRPRTAVRQLCDGRLKIVDPTTVGRKNPEKQSASQTTDLVVTINSVQESSKLELSSGGRRPFKVFPIDIVMCFLSYVLGLTSSIHENSW